MKTQWLTKQGVKKDGDKAKKDGSKVEKTGGCGNVLTIKMREGMKQVNTRILEDRRMACEAISISSNHVAKRAKELTS